MSVDLAFDRRGGGERLVVLLHGLGANATVWQPVIERLATSDVCWIAPDLRGHGRSPFEGPYGLGNHAADVAHLIDRAGSFREVHILGHSFGGVVGALLASGLFGIEVASLLAVGVKLNWSEEDFRKARELAGKPPRSFTDRQEAIKRYLKGAGLDGLVDPASRWAAAGIRFDGSSYEVLFDPRTFAAVGSDIGDLIRRAKCPFRLAAGQADRMVALDDMRALDPAAVAIPDSGHNVHWERPAAVYALLADALYRESRSSGRTSDQSEDQNSSVTQKIIL